MAKKIVVECCGECEHSRFARIDDEGVWYCYVAFGKTRIEDETKIAAFCPLPDDNNEVNL